MAYSAFLQIDGIKGDSSDDAHKNWIEVENYSHSISQPRGGASSAQGVHIGAKADHQDFSITKRLDSASPLLAQFCCNGKHILNVRFELCRQMGDKTTFMVYTLKDCVIASVAPEGSGVSQDPIPFEKITLRYGEIQWEYTPTDPTGGGKKGAAVKAGWSTLLNKQL
jgi:type VI secretion system secreted protein Hcp